MKTYQIKRVIVVAAIACLPLACGTSSPTSPDLAANDVVSALRAEPLPPTAPEMPSPSPEPVPSPAPDPTPDPTSDLVPPASGDEATPPPAAGRRPSAPAGPAIGVPAPPAPNTDGPAGDTPPGAPTPVPSTEPTPSGPVGGTTPPSSGEEQAPECLAASVEIRHLNTFAGTNGVALEASLIGQDGLAITDSSCESLVWKADGAGPRIVITYGATSRFVTISGPAGRYSARATTPNGVSGSLVIVLQ